MVAAVRHGRRGAGAEIMPKYVKVARDRMHEEIAGTLKTRPMNRPVYDPKAAGNSLTISPWGNEDDPRQLRLIEQSSQRYRIK